MATGQNNECGIALKKMMKIGAKERDDLDELDASSKDTQRCQLITWHVWCSAVCSPMEVVLDVDEIRDLDRLMDEFTQSYDYDRMHAACRWTSYDLGLARESIISPTSNCCFGL